jgi:high-affinity nickel-transport protein
MTGLESLLGVALGLGLGARHALEPDHLAAVSVLAADGPGARRGAVVGALWGAGHTMSLLACALVVAWAAAELPARLTDGFELAVAAMLVLLGARALYLGAQGGRRMDGAAHTPGARGVFALRPLVVGALHGLAGSGALTALIMTRWPSGPGRLSFVFLFGIGSIGAMTVISSLAGWRLARLARRPVAARRVFAVVGALSAALGCLWAWSSIQRILQ